jgi:hypothetical protein
MDRMTDKFDIIVSVTVVDETGDEQYDYSASTEATNADMAFAIEGLAHALARDAQTETS